ncbi:hypothetical protein [Ensifer adhaerens]|nr:hypothetical protein [Ensifer adhaerens]
MFKGKQRRSTLEHAALAAALLAAFMMLVAALFDWPIGFLGVGL